MATKSRSSLSWHRSLARELAHLKKLDRPPRVAVVGIGNELAGDDAVGIAVARALSSKACDHSQAASLQIIVAGTAPENFTGTLRHYGPDLVLLVDAAQMDQAPGTVRWLEGESSAGFSASTHSLPLNMLVRYLQTEMGCKVGLLGIQPAHNAIRSVKSGGSLQLSAPVRRAAEEVVSETHRILKTLRV